MKYLTGLLQLLNIITLLIDKWRAYRAVQEARSEVKRQADEVQQRAKSVAKEIDRRVSSTPDAELDRKLQSYFRD